ncbi:fatty acid desaturase [Pendulispora rubella]|uniref:Fatty acid desaturase n=1 Tax=Pendulispora rubella TaxID=2741070 RepID=A0ABZ2LJX6_9BACT
MKTHVTDVEAARAYQASTLPSFVYLSTSQRQLVRAKAKQWIAWRRAHPRLHNAVGIGLLAFLFAFDAYVLLELPRQLPLDLATRSGIVFAALTTGFIHGFLVCSIVTYSVHEGAAHDLIVVGNGPVVRVLRVLANNACRLFLADPDYYAASHFKHHRWLGTEEDGSFTNHVRLRRLLLAIVPMAPVFSHSDYFPWRPQEHTRSRKISAVLTKLHLAVFFSAMTWRFGVLYAVISLLVIGTWISFVFDRLRESTEHLGMPLERIHGTRDFGLGLWGLLLGGGPWGQPCHFSHHLEPALPWYHQLALHFFLRRILTPRQKRQFFLRPVVGFPALLVRLARGRAR